MNVFGICSLYNNIKQLPFELLSVYKEAQKKYDGVVLINPREVSYMFVRGAHKPIILYQNEDISNISSLLVRSTTNSEAAIAILVRSLKNLGCDILDPLERFSVGKASKLLTTISRFQANIGTSSYISFTKTGSQNLLMQLHKENKFPLLIKPISGKQGKGVELVNDINYGLDCINKHFGYNEYNIEPFFLQDYISFKKEYRVLIIDGTALGIVEKIRASDKLVSNAKEGGTFIAVEYEHIIDVVLKNVSQEGMIGVDVAIDENDQIHIIEMNRAPQWQSFEQATGINIAKILVENAMKRLI